MRRGLSIGRVFGIQIRIDASWLFIFLLVVWQLAAGVFPFWHPTWSLQTRWTVAIIAALLFFASVVAHELAHSVVALAKGIPVKNITLFLFGGVSNIQQEPTAPWDEFLLAVVGPVVSIALGVVFLVIGGVSTAGMQHAVTRPGEILDSLSPFATLVLWLGQINILVGFFNLIPGFPLDGGRVLRSIFWAGTNNLRKATRWATWVGHAVAWIFIIAGISMMFGGTLTFLGAGFVSGLWLALIGWFLNNAASAGYRQVVIRDMLEGVPVGQLMRTDVRSVPPDTSVSTLVDEYILHSDAKCYPVVAGDRLLGMACLSDVQKVPREEWGATSVNSIMTSAPELEVAAPGDEASSAMTKLATRDVNQIPVVTQGHLYGILRRQDIMKWLHLHSEGV